ncbi:MAG: hypothetical protein JWM85_946 [Acidimicrobiaceae bacterium]|nr:hypothetical protein [Acidimicrobiaceae bacterium]
MLLAVGAAVVTVGGTLGGVLAAAGGASGVDRSPAGRAVARTLVQAEVLEQNLGVPTPSGMAAASAALVPDPEAGGRLAHAERTWVDGAGRFLPLGTVESSRLLSVQGAEVDRLFAGSLRRQMRGELAGIVADEQRSPAGIASPGGAQVVSWYSVSVSGNTARAEAVVRKWEQRDRVVASGVRTELASSLVSEEVDALATLVRTGGHWRIVSLAEPPWQEPT